MTPSRRMDKASVRALEENLLDLLATAALGEAVDFSVMSPTEVAELGYAAQLARGRIEDPDDRLGTTMRKCRDLLATVTLEEVENPKTKLQARWKAPFPLDLGKIRSELSLRMRTAKRRSALDTGTSAP